MVPIVPIFAQLNPWIWYGSTCLDRLLLLKEIRTGKHDKEHSTIRTCKLTSICRTYIYIYMCICKCIFVCVFMYVPAYVYMFYELCANQASPVQDRDSRSSGSSLSFVDELNDARKGEA